MQAGMPALPGLLRYRLLVNIIAAWFASESPSDAPSPTLSLRARQRSLHTSLRGNKP
jgi:hypothetical protein